MTAPDKIYLVRDAVNPEGIFDSVASKNPMFYDDIAYIRKDALLEWAKRMLVCFKPGFDCHEILKEVVKHIESL